MNVLKVLFVSVALLFGSIGSMASAQQNCAPIDEVFVYLWQEYGESGISMFKSSQGVNYVLFANPDTGSWTLVKLHEAQGMACSVGSGDSYEVLPSGFMQGDPA